MRVLVIDDDPSLRQMLQFVLVLEGFEVLCVADGTEGLKAVPTYQPDVVLLDVMMPRVTGHEVARQLQDDPAYRHIPIVFCTALSSAEDMWTGYEAGAASYLAKPFDPSQLIEELNRVVEPVAA